MIRSIIFLILFTCVSVAQQFTISGTVSDMETGDPLSGANVYQHNSTNGTVTDNNGEFKLTINPGLSDTLKVSYIGYDSYLHIIPSENNKIRIEVKLEPSILSSQTVLIEASVGKEGITPLAFEKIKREEISREYNVQDIPEFLSRLPSTTFYSEGGNGIGYNYLSIRGFDQRRISVSINGIPQNDPEDHNVYWLDFPDLLASTELIQVQRGAGSGVTGSPAIGGSINIITSVFTNKPKLSLSASYGSYVTKKFSAAYSSGLIDNKYSIYAKLSQIKSGGYRDQSWVEFNSYHLSAIRYDENLTTQINFYGGPISDGLAYTGVAKFAVKDEKLRRENYSYWEADDNGYTFTLQRRPEEIENFNQPHYELLNEVKLSDNLKFNSALFLVLGDGFFDYDGSWADTSYLRLTSQSGFSPTQNPGNILIRAKVENTQYGWIPRLNLSHKNGELIFGGEFRLHNSIHWGSINYGENLPAGITKDFRYYYYEGGKDIFGGFIHESYRVNEKLNLIAELQLAYHEYRIENERYLDNKFEISDLFLNPRAGINYKFNENQNAYFSFARVTREPRLKNYYDAAESSGGAEPQFEVNNDGSYNFDSPLVEPETMNDFELGTSFQNNNLNLSLNFFYMLFDDEIVKNGELDRFGQPVTGNVDQTLHYGAEVSGIFKPIPELEFYGNATYSKNEIKDGKFYLNSTDFIDLSGNRISGFPDFLANFGLTFSIEKFYLKLNGKYVGKIYSDNYDENLSDYLQMYPGFISYNDNVNEEYFVMDLFTSYEFNFINGLTDSKVFLQVNNLFDNLYSAYAIGKEFFPAAERNYIAGVQLGL